MKIVHLGFNHRYDDVRIFQKECCSLAKRKGYEVYYITSDKNSGKIVNQTINQVKVITIPLKAKNRLIRLWKYLKDIKEVTAEINPDVCHIHELYFLFLAGWFAKKGTVVFDSHEDWPKQWSYNLNYSDKKKRWIECAIKGLETVYLKKSDYCIGATPYITNILKRKFSTKKVVNINNFPIRTEEKRSYAEKERAVCYAGGISKGNGIISLIQAMEYVDGKLLLAGTIEENLKHELMQLKGWEKVEEYGYIKREEVHRLYEKSVCGIVNYFPSPNCVHALPNKLFEYMESGLPIIASDFPLWKKIIEASHCGRCVNPADSKQVAKEINYLLDNPSIAEEMGHNGKIKVERKYNWNIEEKKLFDLYYQIEKMGTK